MRRDRRWAGDRDRLRRDGTKGKEGGHCLQWQQADFEKIWMRNKGGVGMVICPPENAPERLVKDLPAYPRPLPTEKKTQ